MKQKILALLLCLCMVSALLPHAAANEAASGTWGNISWDYTDGVLTISGEGDMLDEIDGESLYNRYYPYSNDVKKIIIEEGITSICSGAFSDFIYATEVCLPSTLTKIEDSAFIHCLRLDEITIPAGVTQMGNSVFSYSGSVDITFTGDAPQMKVYNIVDEEGDWGTLDNVSGTIYYPGNNATWTEEYMSRNYGIHWGGETYVWEPYFSGVCGEELTWYLEEGTLYIQGQGEMYDYNWDTPAPWMELEFTRVEIGSGVTSIGTYAFDQCYDLNDIDLYNTNLTRIGAYALSDTAVTSVYLPEGLTEIEEGLFSSAYYLTNVCIPDSVTTIGKSAFTWSDVESLIIPDSVTAVGDCAFDSIPGPVYFTGDAPAFVPPMSMSEDGIAFGTFGYYCGTVYYPANNATWDGVPKDNYYEVTWVPYWPTNPFTDVPADSFYYDSVLWALENGITNGATADSFDPNGQCLRAQVVTFLHRAAENPEPTSTANPFTDVKSSDFFYKSVLWAVEKNITNGVSATKFGSYDVCNRAAVVTFLWRAAGSPEPKQTAHSFTDIPKGSFYEKPVLWAIENGITNGISATEFGPNSPCNRAQVVTFLYRAYN